MIFRFLLTYFLDIFPSSFFAYRRLILRLMGIKVHPTAKVNSGFRIYGTGKLEIGSNTWIGRNCHFYTIGNCGIKIGSNTEIGPETMVNCQTHKTGTSEHRAGDCNNHPVEIGNGIWIGTRTTILCNKIGDGTVIGAASLVLQDIPGNCMAAGVPAKIKKNLD